MKKRLILVLLLLCALAFALLHGQREPQQHVLAGKVFGTYYRLVTHEDIAPLQGEIDQLFASINQEMSVFEPSSLINQINAAPSGASFTLSPALAHLMAESKRVYELSGGAYDPTVEPLVDLWGFGKSKQQQEPTPEALAAALAKVGFNGLELSGNKLTKRREGLSLDLSSVAKGYAVDALAELLTRHGLQHYIVDIGGELKAKGKRDGKHQDWQAGIQAPDEAGVVATMAMPLHNLAVATSGDYRRVLESGDTSYSHIISPKTGLPARSDFASVSVFHPSALMADIYATAFMTMPAADAIRLAKEQKLSVIFIPNSPKHP
ncbi:MAG: FAD:protein FMN transferase [Akkermansia sp.]